MPSTRMRSTSSRGVGARPTPPPARRAAAEEPARSSMQDFQFVMGLNRASVGLMKACATGQHIKTATLSARKAGKGQQEYLTFKFHDVLVSSFQTSGSEEAFVPTDSVSFNFAKIEVEYKPQKADGSLGSPVEFRYDLKTNKTF